MLVDQIVRVSHDGLLPSRMCSYGMISDFLPLMQRLNPLPHVGERER